MSRTYASEAEAATELRRFQRLLGLSDWTIQVRIVPAKDMGSDPENDGTCRFSVPYREAVIKLVDPATAVDGLVRELDHRVTLIHELLHLHIEPIGRAVTINNEECHDMLKEQAIDAISRAVAGLMDSVDEGRSA